MGEAIISRATAIPDEVLNPIYPVEGRHVMVVTLRDYNGAIMQDYEINCKDGTATYNYKTNESGQVKFSCNSGSANIFVNNKINGVRYFDFNQTWFNISAPVGDVSRINCNLSKSSGFADFESSGSFASIEPVIVSNLILVGGGGGGGFSWVIDDGDGGYYDTGGGGGGAGYMNFYTKILFEKNKIYNLQIGYGGDGGKLPSNAYQFITSKSGGTSYIVGTSYSAVGGSGGGYGSNGGQKGIGGLGNGGNGTPNYTRLPINSFYGQDSSIDFAGGGGGGGANYHVNIRSCAIGGSPYGGKGGIYGAFEGSTESAATQGSRGGGGGGAAATYTVRNYAGGLQNGARGGNGIMRIYL